MCWFLTMDIALGLHDIRTLIGAYLDSKDIDSCRLVNKEWSQSFASLIWRELDISDVRIVHSAFARNAHHVHKLILSEGTHQQVYDLQGLLHIRNMHVKHSNNPRGVNTALTHLAPFIQHQLQPSDLQSLHLLDVKVANSIELWSVIGESCLGLRSLRIDGDLTIDAFSAMWKAVCVTGVQDLQLGGGTSEYWSGPGIEFKTLAQRQKSGLVSKLQKLVILLLKRMSHEGALLFLQLSPQLKKLYFSGWGRGSADAFCQLLGQGAWKDLDSYGGTFKGALGKEQNIVGIIKAMPATRSLRFGGSGFSSAAFAALQERSEALSNLQELSLRGCLSATSSIIIALLQESSGLIKFWADSVESAGLIKSRPWACASTLRLLNVKIELSAVLHETDVEEAVRVASKDVMERLAFLTSIEELSIHGRSFSGRHLVYGAAYGLDHLWSLKKLNSLGKLTAFTEWADLLWAFEHWPRWRDGTVWLTRTMEMTCEKDMLLRNRGIQVSQFYPL